MLTALIVIFFDVTLALACFFGIGAVMQRYEWLQLLVLFDGSLIVIYIGIGLLRSKVEELEKTEIDPSIWTTISSACVVTWFNPQAIIDGKIVFEFPVNGSLILCR
ncbi:MAG: LysE family transporter [Lachnospiraceae bacterium]|nr:LysE family transporter [Lachnospiraceae bacterium]